MNECRVKLMAEGKPYPRSSCAKCGSLLRPGFVCADGHLQTGQATATITDPREFTKQIATAMQAADAALSEHQVFTLFLYLYARSQPE